VAVERFAAVEMRDLRQRFFTSVFPKLAAQLTFQRHFFNPDITIQRHFFNPDITTMSFPTALPQRFAV
jgi:hypothetical protein